MFISKTIFYFKWFFFEDVFELLTGSVDLSSDEEKSNSKSTVRQSSTFNACKSSRGSAVKSDKKCLSLAAMSQQNSVIERKVARELQHRVPILHVLLAVNDCAILAVRSLTHYVYTHTTYHASVCTQCPRYFRSIRKIIQKIMTYIQICRTLNLYS